MRFNKLLLVSMVFTLSACGGDGGTDKDGFGLPAPTETLTGVFLDSPVMNIDYTNSPATNAGTTDTSGKFSYSAGETLFFSIGDLKFPQVRGSSIITPMDMANTLNISNSRTMNIVRLLMTLDKDGNPANGITITDTAKATATQVDFSLTGDEFAASGAVTNLIYNGGQDMVVPGLVSEADAYTHFEAELIKNNIPYGTVGQKNDRDIQQYLSDNNLQATAHESGMYFNIIAEGSGDSPSSTSTVEVKYVGKLLDNTIFDQTAGDSTVEFAISNLIPGWSIALPMLKPEGKGTFYFPAALGYGAQGSGDTIPPDAVLIFEIELISFKN